MTNYTPIKLAYNVFEYRGESDVKENDIILIHGITSSKETWYEIAQKLADESGSRIFALDMRNHGDSGWSDIFDYDVMAQDVVAFIDEHCINPPTLIGHSMGGKVVMTVALSQSDKISALIVEDMPPTAGIDKLRKAVASGLILMKNLLELIPQDMDLPAAIKFVGQEMLKNMPSEFQCDLECGDKIISTLQLARKEGRFAWKMNYDVLEKFILNTKSYDLEGFYEKPALFLYGTSSSLKVFQAKDLILKLFPKAQLRQFENTGHDIHFERPEKFCQEVLQFLQQMAH